MDELLTPVSTKYLKTKRDNGPLLAEARPSKQPEHAPVLSEVASADDALQVLKGQPGYDSLIAVLRYLTAHAFWLQVPTPQSASIVHVLVTDITPNYWTLLRQGSADDGTSTPRHVELLLSCLRSVSGLNAIVAHVRALTQESRLGNQEAKRPDITPNLDVFLDVLATLLDGNDAVRNFWASSATNLPDAALKRVQSQQLAALLANGRVLSTAAEASSVVGTASPWVADGVEYSKWIGRNLSSWAKTPLHEDEGAFCFDVFQRSMSLGYPGSLVKTVIDELLLSKDGRSSAFVGLCFYQPRASKKVMDMLLEYLAKRFLNNLSLDDAGSRTTVAAVAGAINAVIGNDHVRKTHLINWCTASSGAGLGDAVGIRRAVVAVLARDKESVSAVLEKSLAQFGDQLYIKHAAMLQQEVHTQVLLLSAGYVARLAPIKLTMLLKCGTYMSAISNRIAATQVRSRFLGMVVGETLSALVDNKTKKLDFHMEEMETDEAEWLKGLAKVTDNVGPSESIISAEASHPPALSAAPSVTMPKAKPKPRPKKPAAKVPTVIIEEVDSSDGDEELVPYVKGSDPEDSDDDAALVQRNKPKAPVYVRDLIAYLRDSESYDKQKLALQTAPVLVRRKANFGTEVSAHAEELAGLLVGLQDKFDMDDFVEGRQQAMIALVVAQPKSMAPWFARTFFEGDFSLAQRTAVLVTLGLSARELAGYETSEHQSAASFPSKRLPQELEQLYLDSRQQPEPSSSSRLRALPLTALESVTRSLTASFLGPLAAEAADASSGPNVMKLQTFTERYRSTRKTRPRVRAIANTSAALLATYFFSPLTAHFQLALRSSRPAVLNPGLLSLYLQTVAIVVNAAGPSTLALPQLTSELWDLLLRVRTRALGDVGAMKGWLIAMTVLMEVNEGDMRRVCEDQGREVVETREWVGGVFERTRGEDGGEENEVKMLAAGVLIKLGEAIERYQALLMGDLVGFS